MDGCVYRKKYSFSRAILEAHFNMFVTTNECFTTALLVKGFIGRREIGKAKEQEDSLLPSEACWFFYPIIQLLSWLSKILEKALRPFG